jgi:hypothetical protein
MPRTWMSIQVELVSGRGEDLWPRPGRIFAAARSHTFAQLSEAINAAFARWDLAHLCTVAPQRIDSLEQLGIVPDMPTAYWGWGDMPDQYGRRSNSDYGEPPTSTGPNAVLSDPPPLLPDWGPDR